MSEAKLNIMVRVFRRRIAGGETFEEIAESYPRLTDGELIEIKSCYDLKSINIDKTEGYIAGVPRCVS